MVGNMTLKFLKSCVIWEEMIRKDRMDGHRFILSGNINPKLTEGFFLLKRYGWTYSLNLQSSREEQSDGTFRHLIQVTSGLYINFVFHRRQKNGASVARLPVHVTALLTQSEMLHILWKFLQCIVRQRNVTGGKKTRNFSWPFVHWIVATLLKYSCTNQ